MSIRPHHPEASDPFESPKTFTLRSPIKDEKGNEIAAEVTLREPCAGDIEQIEKDSIKDGATTALIRLISKQSKLSPTDIRRLGGRDFNDLTGYLGGFLESPKKGETSES